MKSVSANILLKTSASNGLEVITGDICGAYLNANTEENIYSCAGPKFELMVIMAGGTFLEVIKAMY